MAVSMESKLLSGAPMHPVCAVSNGTGFITFTSKYDPTFASQTASFTKKEACGLTFTS
ncbi:hypothetical protein D3C71_1820160 [compost metagenome]